MEGKNILLEIAIATTAGRLLDIEPERLPSGRGLFYRIYCQNNNNGYAELVQRFDKRGRTDIELIVTEGNGAARNRNEALERSDAEIVLFSDDDVTLDRDGLYRIVEAFKNRDDISLLAGRARNEYGIARKKYPSRASRITFWNAAKIGTIELAVRPQRIREACVRFDVNFGAGARYPLGDEYIFVCDAIRAGLGGTHVPIYIATHEDESSGQNWGGDWGRYRGKVFDRALGRLAIPFKLAFLVKNLGKVNRKERWLFIQKFLGSAME